MTSEEETVPPDAVSLGAPAADGEGAGEAGQESLVDGAPQVHQPKKRHPLMIVLIVFGALGALAVIAVGWILVGTIRESGVYSSAENSYRNALDQMAIDKVETQRDPEAYLIKANRPRITKARDTIAEVSKRVAALTDSTDRSDYLRTLRDVDASLRVLQTIAGSDGGASAIALEVEKADAPRRAAEDSLEKAFKAYRAKDYGAVILAARDAESNARKSASALGTLERAHSGLGIADIRDQASATAEYAEGTVELAQASRTGAKSGIESADMKLKALDDKYQGAANRALSSVARALWANPGNAVRDLLRQLDKTEAAHAAVFRRIDEGD